MNGSIQQEAVTIINKYEPNNRVPKSLEQKLTELKRETGSANNNNQTVQ